MSQTITYRRHERLVGQMADRLGADLDEAELRGDLTPEDHEEMVLRCTFCTSPEDCGHLLSQNDEVAEAPDYCRNAAQLNNLAIQYAKQDQ